MMTSVDIIMKLFNIYFTSINLLMKEKKITTRVIAYLFSIINKYNCIQFLNKSIFCSSSSKTIKTAIILQ